MNARYKVTVYLNGKHRNFDLSAHPQSFADTLIKRLSAELNPTLEKCRANYNGNRSLSAYTFAPYNDIVSSIHRVADTYEDLYRCEMPADWYSLYALNFIC